MGSCLELFMGDWMYRSNALRHFPLLNFCLIQAAVGWKLLLCPSASLKYVCFQPRLRQLTTCFAATAAVIGSLGRAVTGWQLPASVHTFSLCRWFFFCQAQSWGCILCVYKNKMIFLPIFLMDAMSEISLFMTEKKEIHLVDSRQANLITLCFRKVL